MKFRTLAVVALALLLPFGAVACSDDSTGDLSKSEISDALQKGGLPKDKADCGADIMKKADLSKDELNDFNGANKDSKAGKAFQQVLKKCMGVDPSALTPTTTQ